MTQVKMRELRYEEIFIPLLCVDVSYPSNDEQRYLLRRCVRPPMSGSGSPV
jgi:hypothetical protein